MQDIDKIVCGSRILLAGLIALGCRLAVAAEDPVTPEQVVGAIENTFGVTPGERRNHTKGTCATGEFVGMPEAAAYSRSPLFSGKRIPVVARFSLAGGNPKAPDTARSPRGMALEFALPDGSLQHMTMLNIPVFGAMRPRTFLDLMVASRPDPATGKPDPEKIKAFKATHPDSRAQSEFMAQNNPPASYASSAYYGIHTFKFIDGGNRTTLVRWRFVPQDGEKRLTDEELKSLPANFLEQRLIERAGTGPVRWDMMVSIGEAGDPENDPTLAWPAARKQVRAGTLTITAAMPQKGAACEPVNFDPLVMGDGIAPTGDPILLFRSPAYALSFARRLGGI
ncbi:catalase-related peroxidase [Sideroxyarcus emersonii]|uniref:Catalase-related peroxidase n=1 Tax=Sideroxyarcus emersonii TaxID=2764705 RepID=A0AAN1XAB5_9PROT|nr:catalase family peroxidase [Sideroxyarcus emersonii]BCK87601.1 catalase-related peroxidase [Sideroxyarcus emersonii]